MELELSRACDLRCIYCYADSGEALEEELPLESILDAVDQGIALGAKKIIVLGGGEPLVYPHLETLLRYTHDAGARIELFTNGMLMTEELAQLLLELRVEPVVKMNSLRSSVQDLLAGRKGATEKIRRGMQILRDVGYPQEGLSLGAQTVICRQNIDELPDMWVWLRERGIIPYFEMLTDQGRATRNRNLSVEPSELESLFQTLARIDEERFGIVWEPHPSVAAFTCNRHLYSCTITVTGDVIPCPGVDITVGNILEMPLKDILAQSPVIRDLRNISERITGTCRECDLNGACYGCRGMAYQATGDYLASDPLCWKRNPGALS